MSVRSYDTHAAGVRADMHLSLASSQDGVDGLRQQLAHLHAQILHRWTAHCIVSDCPEARRVRRLAHAVCVEDATLQALLRNTRLLFASTKHEFAVRSWHLGSSEFQAYVRDVFAETEAYHIGLSSLAVRQQVDLSAMGMGALTVHWIINQFVLQELSCLWDTADGGAIECADALWSA